MELSEENSILRKSLKVVGNVRFDGGGGVLVVLKLFLENLLSLRKPFLLQVRSHVSDDFIFIHSSSERGWKGGVEAGVAPYYGGVARWQEPKCGGARQRE